MALWMSQHSELYSELAVKKINTICFYNSLSLDSQTGIESSAYEKKKNERKETKERNSSLVKERESSRSGSFNPGERANERME